jgi:hypothetical protein
VHVQRGFVCPIRTQPSAAPVARLPFPPHGRSTHSTPSCMFRANAGPGPAPFLHGVLPHALRSRRRALRASAAKTLPADGDDTCRHVPTCRHGGCGARPHVARRARRGAPRHPGRAVALNSLLTPPLMCRSLCRGASGLVIGEQRGGGSSWVTRRAPSAAGQACWALGTGSVN